MKPSLIRGTVVRGEGLGRKLGFPTANLRTRSRLPPFGVYAVKSIVSGRERWGACNIGVRPTVGGRRVQVEVHFPGFRGNLYGRRLSLRVAHRLRGEKKFPGLPALKRAIARDLRVLALLSKVDKDRKSG